MKKLLIVKLGGSVITEKSKGRGAFRKAVVKRLVSEIVEAKKKKDFDLILVHGAGAYPHFLTTKYRLDEGFKGEKTAFGFSLVKNNLFKLNNLVWSECLKGGLSVCTIEPAAVITTNNGEIKHFDTFFVEGLLKLGIIPLLMGDDTLDETRGIAILSGDKTMAYLAKKYKANKIIFVSDVDGVFDKNPKIYKDAKLIREINKQNFGKIIDSMETFNKNDASGEMKGKLLAIKERLLDMDVEIISGFTPNRLKDSLLGNFSGTQIRL